MKLAFSIFFLNYFTNMYDFIVSNWRKNWYQTFIKFKKFLEHKIYLIWSIFINWVSTKNVYFASSLSSLLIDFVTSGRQRFVSRERIIEWHFYAVCKLYRRREVEGRNLEGVFHKGGPTLSWWVSRRAVESTIELGVPWYVIPPSAYDPRAMVRMWVYICYDIRVGVRSHTRSQVERVHCHSFSQPRWGNA